MVLAHAVSDAKAEIAERWPHAVAFAKDMREAFGDGIKLVYARNEEGQEIGRKQ